LNSNISDGSKTSTTSEPRAVRALLDKILPGVEFLVVCALACAVAAIHLLVLNGSNLCLLFDGFGFLSTTAGCISVFNAKLFGQVLSYIGSGFDETARLSLANTLAPAKGIVRSGPLLPILVGFAYTIAGKAAVAQYWFVATWSMWLTQALTVGLVWLSCRLAFNSMVARVAALICMFYPAFVINSNRLSTETQVCFAITLTMTLFLYYAKSKFEAAKRFPSGLLAGLALGFLALARPPFLLLPMLLVVSISLVAWRLKLTAPFSKRWLGGAICGAAIFLAPWALCNQVLTGKPSITIDRFAMYNLYTGLNTASLGFDLLPGDLVAHPERFKMPLGEVLHSVATNAAENPADFLAMVALKPVRLLDSPWNDYQNSCLGVPWLLQRYAHQLLWLFALFGSFALWTRALASKSLTDYTSALLLSLIVSYNFVHLLFISMARYCYPIMPCVIVLAAYGIVATFQNKQRYQILGYGLFAPVISLLVETASLPPFAVLPELAYRLGSNIVSIIFALLISGAFLCAAVAGKAFSEGGKQLTVYLGLSVVAALLICFASYFGMRQITYSSETGSVRVQIPSNQDNTNSDWFVVIDPLLQGFSLDALKTCKVSLNGVVIEGDLFPLMGRDRDQRESFVYQRAFSHSGQKDLTGIRQWYCLPVPKSLIQKGKENVLEFKNIGTSDSKSFIVSDFVEGGKPVAPLVLLLFSWTKGFTVNPPFDMRMLERRTPANETSSAPDKNARIQPRMYLLSVAPEASSAVLSDASVNQKCGTVALGNHEIDNTKNKVVSVAVSSAQLKPLIEKMKTGSGNALQLRLSGNCKSAGDKGKISFALITTTKVNGKSEESMAPMAPEIIRVNGDGYSFSFVDVIPVNGVIRDFDCSLRIMIAGRPWWDVLQYANYKVDQPVAISDLKLETATCRIPDFSKQRYRLFKGISSSN
jgi:4-amino-4-deoxy-L-arabinose transferase-like glycosyltransferase